MWGVACSEQVCIDTGKNLWLGKVHARCMATVLAYSFFLYIQVCSKKKKIKVYFKIIVYQIPKGKEIKGYLQNEQRQPLEMVSP